MDSRQPKEIELAQVSSGRVLRETRERKGYDLTTVARRLRIRPDILRAIEANDFASMPPRGYTRNMVNAYARLLGLNPTEIVNMYLDEAYAHQVQRARSSAPLSNYNPERSMRSGNGNSRFPRRDREALGDNLDYGYEDDYSPAPARNSGRSTQRRLYDDRSSYARDDYGYGNSRTRSSRGSRNLGQGYGSSGSNIYDDGPRRRGQRSIHVGQTPMGYSGSRISGLLSGRLPLIIGAIVLIAVVVLICYFLFGGNKNSGGEDVSQLPVSGINDTTGTPDGGEDENLVVEVEPTSARIVYAVDEGNQVYLETYDNSDTPNAEILDGPEEKTVETTGVWTIATFTPDLLKVTVNGEEVTLKSSEEYNGMSVYTVDFPAMLEEWRKTHTSKQNQRQAAVNSAANAASHTDSSSDDAASAENSDSSNDSSNDDGSDNNPDDSSTDY